MFDQELAELTQLQFAPIIIDNDTFDGNNGVLNEAQCGNCSEAEREIKENDQKEKLK